ncbi:hypothetical protein BRC85_06260 [Halobacteriales archaeon QS_1_69_70]|nr:MAG: hypothetical protein BRC85_06260 [Halobacteriales archaeon QS_1_69_70]
MPDTARGQTVIDFAIAMGVFLVAVAFVFTFIPSLTTPFVEGNQDRSVTADRVASHLAEGALGDPADPYVVDGACAEVFFDGSTSEDDIPDGCGYSGDSIHERVGVDGDRLHVNVTVEQVDPDATGDDRFRTVCTESLGGTVVHEGASTPSCGGAEFVVGDLPTDRDSIVVARRIVTIPGCEFDTGDGTCDATLKVRVW